ncbi:MAG: hypothetical protein ACYDC7_10020 [Acidithiobacillus ferrivorans]
MKVVTFIIAAMVFLITPLINSAINQRIPVAMRAQHAKLAKDAWMKTVILFAGSIAAGFLAFFNGGFDKAITQAFFGMCLFSSLASFWTVKKTKTLIQEAKVLSLAGNRAARIHDVERVNIEKATKATLVSFTIGLLGFLYVALAFDTYRFSWLWFAGFISTAFAILSARWSDAANFAIAKYASDPNHGK